MFRVLILIFAFYNFGFSACYEPCNAYAMQKSNEKQISVNQAYNQLDSKLLNAEEKYQDYLTSLTKQNEILENIINVRKYNSLKMKEVNFLLNKIIEQKNIQIDINLLKDVLKFQKSLINTKDIK